MSAEIASNLSNRHRQAPSKTPAIILKEFVSDTVDAVIGSSQKSALPLLDAVSISGADAARAVSDAYREHLRGDYMGGQDRERVHARRLRMLMFFVVVIGNVF